MIKGSSTTVGATLFTLGLAACSSDNGGPQQSALTSTTESGSAVISITADGAIAGLTLDGLTLTPAFSPTIEDYAVRCAADSNLTTLRIDDQAGPRSVALTLLEDQALVVSGKYWIRCLPHDFPQLTLSRYPTVGSPTPGWYLTGTAVFSTSSAGFAMVLDGNATPVWYRRTGALMDLESFAKNTLSFMPAATAPFGTDVSASFNVVDLDALTTVNFRATTGLPTDGHELRLLENGDHLVLVYPIEQDVDLTGLESYGSDLPMVDCNIQEVDASGNLVWSWLASDHFDPIRESVVPTTYSVGGQSVVDVFHCNSIDVDATGNLLVSSRHMSAVFYIDKATGNVVWKLGGSSFNKDGAQYIQVIDDDAGGFSMQHDARFQPNGDVTMFDDHGNLAGTARAVEYALDFTAHTAKSVFEVPADVKSGYMGSFRKYADGESVIGWGGLDPDLRAFSEVDPSGAIVLDVSFGSGDESYRAVKVPLDQLDINVLRSTAGH